MLTPWMCDILKNAWSQEFIDKMRNRILVSHSKYGSLKKTKQDPTQHRDEVKNIEFRLKKYKETCNPEYMVDVANFAMFEYMEMHGMFRATDDVKDDKIQGDVDYGSHRSIR